MTLSFDKAIIVGIAIPVTLVCSLVVTNVDKYRFGSLGPNPS